MTKSYFLPQVGEDFVLLTPIDILTRDDTWISQRDMIRNFRHLPDALPNTQLRAQVNQYFKRRLGDSPNAKQWREAAEATIERFPLLIDYYIARQEKSGSQARAVSAKRVDDTQRVLVDGVREVIDALDKRGGFYNLPNGSYAECLTRIQAFKHYVEHQDGYKVINRKGSRSLGKPNSSCSLA